jgi:hypothetical protein
MTTVNLLNPAVRTARVAAILAALDAGTGPGRAEIYGTAKPAAGAAAGGAPLVVWTLADPGGTAAGGVLTLAWSAAAYAAAASGTAVWGRLMDSAGNWVLDAECGLLGSAAIFQLESLTVLAGALIQPTTSTITD